MQYKLIILLCLVNYCTAQQPAVGNWREHFPYNQAFDVVATEHKIFVATPYAVLSIDKEDESIQKLSKVNGLSESGVKTIVYNPPNKYLIIGYKNSNIDIVTSTATIINIEDIKRKNINADKTIYKMVTIGNSLFVCTGFGIVWIDLLKKETKDTWYLGTNATYDKVNSIAIYNNEYYAATTNGLKHIPINAPAIANGNNWLLVNENTTGHFQNLISFQNKLIAQRNDSLFLVEGATLSFFYFDGSAIKNISAYRNQLLLSESLNNASSIIVLNNNGTVAKTIKNPGVISSPQQTIQDNNTIWVADEYGFLSSYNNDGIFIKRYEINSPIAPATGQIKFANDNLFVASGGVNNLWQYTYNQSGYSIFNNDNWSSYTSYNQPLLNNVFDINVLDYNPVTSKWYAGSFGGGLVETITNIPTAVKKESLLQPAVGDPQSYRVAGIAVDIEGNTWVTNYGAIASLICIKTNGTIQKFNVPFGFVDNALGYIVIDPFNQKWITAPKSGGLVCFNHGRDIENTGDDQWKLFKTGTSNGNLSDNEITSIAIDKQSNVWVGTYNGISVFPCIDQVFTANGCAAYQPVIQSGTFAGYLLQGQIIQSIAIDGANRKWLATQNGVFLTNADGDKIIQQFTTKNSPLPTNDVKTIGIQPNTGEVFMGTTQGMVSFVSDATEATEAFGKVQVYPNPVPKGYYGFISVKGLANNAIIKIINTEGALIWQGVANGGTISWNGLNYLGKQIASGMYIILMRSATGEEKQVCKLAIIK